MIPEHGVLLKIIRLGHEGSDGIVSQGQTDTEQEITRDKGIGLR